MAMFNGPLALCSLSHISSPSGTSKGFVMFALIDGGTGVDLDGGLGADLTT